MNTSFNLQHTLLAMALAAAYPLTAGAVPAGVAQFTTGEVILRGVDGKTDTLSKGKDIESGQAIITGANGRAQVRFSDGGLVSLQPGTEFKVANYVDQADPKQDRFLVDLLRGSMRAITGLIGKRNRDNYRVTTTTATIGIRGSGFSAGYNPDGSLGVTTELDAIEVCNAGGCVGLTAGESVRVVNSTDAPVRTNVRASVPTPNPPQELVLADRANDNGRRSVVQNQTSAPVPAPAPTPDPAPTPTPTPAPPVNTGTYTDLNLVAGYYDMGNIPGRKVGPNIISSATLSDGKLTSFIDSTDSYAASTTTGLSYLGNITDGDFIGWGTWLNGSKNVTNPLNDVHYVVGQPTPLLNMPTTGTINYNLVGQTPVTGYASPSGPATASGTLTSAGMTADFANGKLAFNIVTTLGNVNLPLNEFAFTGNQFSYSSTSGGRVDGFFSGPNAIRAGIVYGGTNTATSTIFSGAAVFQKP